MFVWIITVLIVAIVAIVAALLISAKGMKSPANGGQKPAPEAIRRGKFLNK